MSATTNRRTAASPVVMAVDVPHLEEVLLGTWGDLRRKARELAADPRLIRDDSLPMAEHRERILEQMHILVNEGEVLRGFPRAQGGQDDPGGNVAGFGELAVADPSLQIKSGVQFGLFASAIMHLGTETHHERLLPDAIHLRVPGAFAMTEMGHGSDVASLATTATYDPDTEEFDLHTPFKAAWKAYLGNAAAHGTAAVVFAQLISKSVGHGVHAFYVPIREVDDDGAAGEFLPGIGGDDHGLKGGLNGIDNGRLHFTHVRVPRANLLNRYGDVAADGTYTSSIASPGRRFFTMLGTLVQGRVSLTGAAVSASEMALKIAVTYGNQRRQFAGADPHSETVLMDYQRHQRRLLPLLAETFAAHFAHETLVHLFDEVFSGRAGEAGTPEGDAARQDLETMAAACKATSTWHALTTLQTAREACGGAGYMTENRLTGLHADLDVYATFEGDNTVLLQLVAKRLLADYAAEFKNIDAGGVVRFVADKAAGAAWYGTPLARAFQAVSDGGDARRSALHLREAELQRELLADRVETMTAEVAGALRPATKASRERASELFNDNQNSLIEAARAHADLVLWDAFTAALPKVTDLGTREVLTRVRDLFGLVLIERNLAWYLMHGRISSTRARAVGTYIDRLVARLRPHAQDLVDSFGYEARHIRAAIIDGSEAERQDEARAYQRAARAAGTEPVAAKAPAKTAR